MSVQISDQTVSVEHKTGLVDVNDLLKVGNLMRARKGLQPMTMPRIKRSKELQGFVEAVKEQIQQGHYKYFDVQKELIFTTGKVGKETTRAFLPVAIKIASIMDANFEAEVYRVFIEEKVLRYRDESGEEFKALNIIIDTYLNNTDNRGIYIAVATQIREKVFPGVAWNTSEQGNIWNSPQATADKLRMRASIESKLSDMLRLELIKDLDQLKEVIIKL